MITQEKSQENKRVNKKVLWILIMCMLVLSAFAGGYYVNRITQSKNVKIIWEVSDIVDKVGYVYDPVSGEYIEFDGEKVAQIIADNFLDEYSHYYTKEEYEEELKRSAGQMSGFGISYDRTENKVFKIIGNSPAEAAGMKKGDVITAYKENGEEEFTALADGQAVAEYLGGVSSNKTVTLKINNGDEREVSIKKSDYIATYVSYYDSEYKITLGYDNKKIVLNKTDRNADEYPELNGQTDVAYIKLDAFNGDADKQFAKIMDYAKTTGLRKSLVLDLRGNGGGQMDILTEIASYLLDVDKPVKVAYAKEKNRTTHFEISEVNFNDNIQKISVIADKNTASASECLLGAMLYHYDLANSEVFGYGRLVIVGEPESASTYGKGIMQTTYVLESGGALKLTTARVLWPNLAEEICIHGIGIKPDREANAVSDADALTRAIQTLGESALKIQTDGDE